MNTIDARQVGEKQNIHGAGRAMSVPEEANQEKNNALVQEDTDNRTGVTVDFSEQAMDMLQRQLEASRDSADAMGKAAADQAKIMEIARRISRGDKVPAKDEKKLMEFDFKLYQMAKMSGALNAAKKHKKHKSLFEDEESDMDKKLRELTGDMAKEAGSDAEIESAGAVAETGSEGTEAE